MKAAFSALLAGLIVLFVGYKVAHGATLTATPATFEAQLARAQPGDVLILSAGEYVNQRITRRTFSPSLIIDANAAVVSQMIVTATSGVQFLGGEYRTGCVKPVDPEKSCSQAGLRLSSSTGISINGGRFKGPEYGADGYGLFVQGGSNIKVSTGVFERFKVGLVLATVDGFNVTDTQYVGVRSDGFNIGLGSKNGEVVRAYCYGTAITKDEHPDCGQLYSRPGLIVQNVEVRSSVAIGETQGFAGFNHIRDGVNDGGFDNVRLIGNRVYGTYPQAISINDCRECVLRDNHVFTLPSSRFRASINSVRSTFTQRCGNTVAPGAGKPGVLEPAC